MTGNDATLWMWTEACQMLVEAERLHRQFFTLGPAGARATWEPPVGVYEDDEAVEIVVALPGVPPECIEVGIEDRGLVVRARCEFLVRTSGCVVQRMEIPHGHFERRIALPDRRLDLEPPQSRNGLLLLRLRKQY